MKQLYVKCIRILKYVFLKIKIIQLLENFLSIQFILFIRSFFSIHDIEDLVYLDLPWWTLKSKKYVDSFLKNLDGNALVFEYGPGASTIWLSKRCKKIYYVEHDESFFNYLSKLTKNYKNIKGYFEKPKKSKKITKYPISRHKDYKNLDFSNYVNKIRAINKKFDLIIIDGRSRTYCLKESLKHLKENGLIVFDNTLRKRYQESFENEKLNILRLKGITPGLPYLEETSIIKINKY